MAVRCVVVFLALVVLVYTDSEQEERAVTDIELAEFDLDDQCVKKANVEWLLLTSNETSAINKQKVQEDKIYGNLFKSLVEEVIPYKSEEWKSEDLNRKLRLITSGDFLLSSDEYNEGIIFANDLQQIRQKYDSNSTDSCHFHHQGTLQTLLSSRDPDELLKAWSCYHKKFNAKAEKFSEILQLQNAAAEANGAIDVETYWQSLNEFPGGYAEIQIMWNKIEPLYKRLHSFVLKQLSKQYEALNSSNITLIPAHLLGSVLGIDWTLLAEHVIFSSTYQDILFKLEKYDLKGVKLYRTAEGLIENLGLGILAPKFWENSWFNSSCPATFINYCGNPEENRIITCDKAGWMEFLDAHETTIRLKHKELEAEDKSFFFRESNQFSILDEAVAGLSSLLASTSWYLKHIGLQLTENDLWGENNEVKTSLTVLIALKTLPQLPYYLASDLWRIEVLNKNMTNITDLQNVWRKYRKDMQMVEEGEDVISFLSDPYITSNKPYLSKFSATILQFQLLEQILNEGEADSNEDDIKQLFSSKENLKKLLTSGKSESWSKVLEDLLQIEYLDARPLLRYFENLETYLEELEELKPIVFKKYEARSTTVPTVPVKSEKMQAEPTTGNISIESRVSVAETSKNITFVSDEQITEVKINNEPSNNSTIQESGVGTMVLFGCIAVAGVVIVIAVFIFGRKRYLKRHAYRQSPTQET